MSKLIGTAPNQVPSNADLGTMAYVDVPTAAQLIGGRRNLLINSNFEVNQRLNSFPLTTPGGQPTFVVDRWKTHGNGMETIATINYVTLPNGVKCNSLKTQANPVQAVLNSWLHPAQYIEFSDYFKGKTVVFSAWVRTNLPKQQFRYCDGTSCYLIGDVNPGDGQWHYMWAKAQISDSATAMNWQVFGNALPVTDESYLEIAQPQLEFGEYPTAFEYRPYGEELALCQRYFYRFGHDGINDYSTFAWGNKFDSTRCFVICSLPVNMRAEPSLQFHGNLRLINAVNWTEINTGNSTFGFGNTEVGGSGGYFRVDISGNTIPGNTGDFIRIEKNGDNDAGISFDAELN